jgi:hypothetical protein
MLNSKLIFKIIVILIVLGSIIFITGVGGSTVVDASVSATSNGDGVLSVSERRALNAKPVGQVTRADMLDVRESDLPTLDADLRQRIQTPVTVSTQESSSATERAQTSNRDVTWRHKNWLGATLYWYRLGVSWVWNGSRVRDVDSYDYGDGSWGWHFCGSSPRGEEWTAYPRARRAFGFGHFGLHPVTSGCILGERILGGSITVTASGNWWWRNGSCCD